MPSENTAKIKIQEWHSGPGNSFSVSAYELVHMCCNQGVDADYELRRLVIKLIETQVPKDKWKDICMPDGFEQAD